MGALSNYSNAWTEDDVDKDEQEQEQKKGPGSAFLRIAPDTSKIVRVIPKPGGGPPYYTFFKHTYRDPTTGQLIGHVCCDQANRRECPSCRQAYNLISSKIKIDKDLGFQMRAKPRAFLRVLVRPDEEDIQKANDEGLDPPTDQEKLWEISSWVGKKRGKSMHERLNALRKNTRRGGDFTDPGPDGFDLLIERHGEKLSTTYEVYALNRKDEVCPLCDDEQEAIRIIEEPEVDPEEYMSPPTEDEAMQIIQGDQGSSRRALPDKESVRAELLPRQRRSSSTASDFAEEDSDGEGGFGDGF